MAKYRNPNAGTVVTVNHKGGHVRLSHGDVKEIPSDANLKNLISLGKLVEVVEEEKQDNKASGRAKAEAAPVNSDTNSNK